MIKICSALLAGFLPLVISGNALAYEKMHSESEIAQFLAAARADLAAHEAGEGKLVKIREQSYGYIIFLFGMKDGTFCRSYITSITEPVTGFESFHQAPHSLGLVCGIRGRD